MRADRLVSMVLLLRQRGRMTADELAGELEVSARTVLRAKGDVYETLGLADPKWSDAQLIDFMLQHPAPINRPIVVTPQGTRLCRPADTVREILPKAD
mgnify:CR=1 FL=1